MLLKNAILILVAAIFLNSCGNKEKALVEDCFNSYKSAILKSKGSEAVNFVTQSTIDQYGELLDWCKHYGKEDIGKLSFMNRLLLIAAKHRSPKELILSCSGKEFFEYAVDSGWVGKESVMQAETSGVSISSGQATADVIVNGMKAPFKYHFIKEGGKWKFDLLKVMQDANVLMKKMIQQKGMDEDEFILLSVESVSGKKVQNSIWEPIVKKNEQPK